MKRIFSLPVLLVLVLILGIHPGGLALLQAQSASPMSLTLEDEALLNEAEHLRKTLGDKIWPGWSAMPSPVLYVAGDYEFAVGFPRALSGFRPQRSLPSSARTVQVRKRVLAPNLVTSFPIDDIPAVIIGRPAALEIVPGQWVLTALHEMFHLLQFERGETEKTAALKLGSETDVSWQQKFPFPNKKDPEIKLLMHVQSYLFYLAATATDEDIANYSGGTAVEAVRLYQNALRRMAGDDQFYKFSQLLEWKEGIALYTEYKIAEEASRPEYQPTEAFLKLAEAQPYRRLLDEQYARTPYLAKHAGRVDNGGRLSLSYMGLAKALLLDRKHPNWKEQYFSINVWLDDMVLGTYGQLKVRTTLTVGMPAPDFELSDINGRATSLKQRSGQVVLLDFWQTWCGPCIAAIPHLKALQEKYQGQGFQVFGITSLVKPAGLEGLRKMIRETGMNYQNLLDEKGAVSMRYDVQNIPQLCLIGRDGRIAYLKTGYIAGDEEELEREIQIALAAR